jgi:class 3 adenylate cyclase
MEPAKLKHKSNNKKLEKMTNVAEILGLLDETHKDKEWLLREIKRHKLKLPTKSSMNSFQILQDCPEGFISHLLRVLKHDNFNPAVDIPVLVKTFHWFYTDLVGSSDPTILTKDQARNVWILNELIGKTETFMNRDPESDVMNITGDGMSIGFSDAPEKPLHLAIELHKFLSKYNQQKKGKSKLKIRIGIDTGPVYLIKDLTGKENFWGPGIIMARRVMDLARPMQILASARIANDIRKLTSENKSIMHHIGDYKIKHGEKLSIFNIYGEGFGNRHPPPNPIIAASASDPNPSKFLFPKVELRLDITDPKTMMCHHTWLWNVINITDEPTDQVSYYLEGDTPRDFVDLNVTIKDDNSRKIKISSLNVNRPERKEFIVKLNKPIKPNQKGVLKLEYDWEEPERKFFYTMSTDCKKFKYWFTIPKGVEITPRVLKVDPATRYKTYASPPEIKYLKDKTEISWQALNVRAYEGYQFEW